MTESHDGGTPVPVETVGTMETPDLEGRGFRFRMPRPVQSFLDRTRPMHSPFMLLSGVLWDFATLRIDRLADSMLLGVYLLVFQLMTIIQLRYHLGTGLPGWISTRIHWAHNLGQFLLGGLLSAYLIFYVRGAPLLRGLVWLLILGALAVANEYLPRWLKLPELWVALLTVLGFHFVLAAGPVLTGQFIGLTSPLLFSLFLGVVTHALATTPYPGVQPDQARVTRLLAGSSVAVGGAMLLEVLFFRADLIPPLPLTLMKAEVVPDDHEAYEAGVISEVKARLGFAPKVKWTKGLKVSMKTPVFLPKTMSTRVLHIWEFYDEEKGWTRMDAIGLDITGGRPEGYRTYSHKRSLKPGSWRVRVTTSDERELGRVRFDLLEG